MSENSYAIVDSNNIVLNIVLWNGDTTNWAPPEGATAIIVASTDCIHIGEIYNPQPTTNDDSTNNTDSTDTQQVSWLTKIVNYFTA